MYRKRITISGDLLKILLHYAGEQGIEPDKVLKQCGLDTKSVEGCNSRIPVDKIRHVWTELVYLSGDENFGLHLGEMADRLSMGSILFSVMMNSATLGSALEKLARYHDLTTDFVRLQIEREGYKTYLVWQAADEAFSLERHYVDCVFCGLILPIKRLSQNQVKPVAVHCRYDRPADQSELQRVFACSLDFSSASNQVILHNDDLEKPIFAANAELLEELEAFAQSMLKRLYPGSSWADLVVQKINDGLGRGERPKLAFVARELAISPRQLQNRLKRDGITYQELLDNVRKETALRCLQKRNMAVCDIAFLLGFSEQSAFTHAFKRWTGDTPGNYQRDRTE